MTIIVHSRGGSWSKLGKVFSILFNAPFNLVFIISGVSDHSDAEYLLSTVTKSCHKLETLKVIHCSKLSDDCISSLVESKVAHSLKVCPCSFIKSRTTKELLWRENYNHA